MPRLLTTDGMMSISFNFSNQHDRRLLLQGVRSQEMLDALASLLNFYYKPKLNTISLKTYLNRLLLQDSKLEQEVMV